MNSIDMNEWLECYSQSGMADLCTTLCTTYGHDTAPSPIVMVGRIIALGLLLSWLGVGAYINYLRLRGACLGR